MRFFNTHAGKSVLFIGSAAFMLAWPPAFPWVMAVILLQLGVRHLILSFKEVDRVTHASVAPVGQALPEPHDGERGLARSFSTAIHTRP